MGMEPSLQRLLERSGNDDKGSITGIYTVLVENDDFNAPIVDMARGILDGHIVLTRRLADKSHFPAIDVLSSVSRVMPEVVDDEHYQMSRTIKKYLAIYEEIEDQYKLGLIEKGKDILEDNLLHGFSFRIRITVYHAVFYSAGNLFACKSFYFICHFSFLSVRMK